MFGCFGLDYIGSRGGSLVVVLVGYVVGALSTSCVEQDACDLNLNDKTMILIHWLLVRSTFTMTVTICTYVMPLESYIPRFLESRIGYYCNHKCFDPKPKSYNPKHECFHPKHECFHPKHECFHPKHECFHPKHECFDPKHECFNPKHQCFDPKHQCSIQNINVSDPKHEYFLVVNHFGGLRVPLPSRSHLFVAALTLLSLLHGYY